MKKCLYFFSAVIFLGLLSSCSHNQGTDIVYLNEDTLQAVTESKENDLQWTRELESVRLLRDISKNEAVSSSIKLTNPVVSIASSEFFGSPIYPVLPGFGSLNTSSITQEFRKSLDDFCNDVSQWNISEKTLESSSLFFAALFKFDIENGWKTYFGKDFPVSINKTENKNESESESGTESGTGTADEAFGEGQQAFETVLEEKQLLFEHWIYGEPFFDEDNIQTPVRFFCRDGSIDVLLYSSKENFKLNQILIQKWNKK